jgi:hypothetical protein
MRKLACLSLILTIFACTIFFTVKVDASTPVSGIITTNTVWTVVDSPIELTGNLCVYEGATLTIEPGATVNLGTYYLQVNGTLKAQGTKDNKMTFTCNESANSGYGTKRIDFNPNSVDWNEKSQSGSIIEHATFYSVGIFVLDASPQICNNIFPHSSSTAINIGSGSPYVCNNEIIGSYAGSTGNGMPCLAAHGSPIVVNNTIVGNGYQTGMTATHTAIVANNTISNCWSGIKAADSATIVENVIVNNYDSGIICESGKVAIHNNYIGGNKHKGIEGGGNIQRNTIANSLIGINSYVPEIILVNNNILNNSQNSIYLLTSNNLEAKNNYWGTTNIQSINQTIRDFKNDFKLGIVNFVPVLGEPVDIGITGVEQPIVTPIPTPIASQTTPQPTTTQPAITPDPDNFSIESNSTVTAFNFDSTTQQISFTVSGPQDTTGYVKITIAKTCMSNSDFDVYLDGDKINYDLASTSATWVITFNYHHSNHQVTIGYPTKSSTTPELPDWIMNVATVAVAVSVMAAVGILVWLNGHKTKPKQI